jgi:hypothetical protein
MLTHQLGVLGGLGGPEIMMILIVLGVLGAMTAVRSNAVRLAGPALVLRKFSVVDSPGVTPAIEIAGRASGFIGWLLTVFGLGAETTFVLKDDEIRFQSVSLAGQIHNVVPVQSVSSTHCGFSKPIGLLLLGFLFAASGILALLSDSAGTGLLLLLIGGVCLVAYFVRKKLAISLQASGGMVLGLAFKPGVLENVSVDMPEALRAIEVLNRKIVTSHNLSAHAM